MINLLPAEYKKELVSEYRVRLGAVALLLIAGVFCTGVLFILPSFFLVYSQERVLVKERMRQESMLTDNANNTENVLQLSAHRTNILETKYTREALVDLIGAIIKKRSSGITLSTFQYEHRQDGTDILVLKGLAQTRDELVQFEKVLEEELRVKDVQLPISDLAGRVDIAFTMNLTLALTKPLQ